MNATPLNKLTQTWTRRLGAALLLPVLTVLFALSATNALATLTAYEPFNYTTLVNGTPSTATGTPTQTTGGGFSGNWTCSPNPSLPTGLSYTALPVANKAMQSGGNGRQFVSFASSISTGTKYISFLLNLAGNSGGNNNGVYLLNGGTGLWFGQGNFGVSSTTGPMYLGTVNTAGSGSQTPTQVATPYYTYTFGTTYFVVLKIVYPNSVTAYINPTANSQTPGTPLATQTATISVGTISGIGLQVVGGGTGTLDEIRVGDTYADVSGVSIVPVNVSITTPTNNQTVDEYSFPVSATASVTPGSVTNVAFYLDTVLYTNFVTSPYNFNVIGVSAGAHTLYAAATDSSNNVAMSSTNNIIAADLPPSVTLTNPANASQILTGSGVSLGASATDDSAVTNVGFYVDGALVGNSTTSPYSAPWTATAGAHQLKAVATDNAGQSSTSAVVNVTGTLPTVSITSPTNTQTVSIYTYTVSATATVSPGTITNVDLFVDSVFFANKTASPYTFTVAGAAGGAHTLQAVAKDSNGNSVSSTVINVTAADLFPTVAITNTALTFLTGSNLLIGAAAADDNAVTNVNFYVDGLLVGSSIASPYSTTWVVASGPHALTAVAQDSAGQSTTSAALNITGTLPTVSITSPTNTQAVSVYSYNVTATAAVTPAGTITNVDLIVDSAFFANKTASPYTFTVTGASASAHTLQAVAKDSNGNSVTSTLINVTAADLKPSVTVTNPANGALVLAASGLTLGASATDDSAVTNVAFYVDGGLVGSSTTSPYSTIWGVTSLGAHTVTAVAMDSAGQSTTSAVVNVTAVLNFNVYEPFNYSSLATGNAATGTGMFGNWTVGTGTTTPAGLTYGTLPTANNRLSMNASANTTTFASFAQPLSSGTKYISFLVSQAGDDGGNVNAVFFQNGGTSLAIANAVAGSFTLRPYSAGTSGSGTLTSLAANAFTGSYNTPAFVVIRIDFNTSGNNDTVTVYINSATNAALPGIAAKYTLTTFDVGTITGVGMRTQGGNLAFNLDEVRTGDTYGSVAGLSAPSAPTSLVATPGNNQVSLTWTAPASGSPTGYNVKRSGTNGWNYSVVGTTSVLSFTDSTATNGTTYYYVVSGTNAAGEGPNSNQGIATPVAPPGQPQNVVAYPGVNSVGLSWDAVSGATGYLVSRGPSSGPYTLLNSVASNTNFDATAAGDGVTAYCYVVQATNAGGASAQSLQACAVPTPAPPSPPSGLAATPSSSQVSLNWLVGLGATGYNVKRSTNSLSETTIGTAGGTSYTDSTAANGNIYYYTVSSTNRAGESIDSNEATAPMPPATPTGLTATAGTNQVLLSWTASSGPSGATSYNVKRSTNSGSGYATIGTTTAPTVAFTDSTAISGTTYYYVVSGVNTSGEGDNSSPPASATPIGPPQAPTGLTLTTNYTSLTLNWIAAQGVPTGYNVKRSTTNGFETTLPAGTNVAGTTFTDTNVSVGTVYFYKVSAVNGDGEGADSSEVAGTVPGNPSAYEPFNYASIADGTASTAAGFTGTWKVTNASPAIVSGLTYPNLYASNTAFQVASGNQYENLSIPLFSGTVYVSFLYFQAGDFGGNRGGLQLLNASGNGLMFAYHQYGQSVGLPSIDSIIGYTSVDAELGASVTPQTYATANLYVLRLDYNSAGALTNVAVYSNPAVGQPAPAPDFTVSSGLSGIGTITAMGMKTGISTTVGEWRVGTTFASVVVGKSVATVTLLGNLNPTYDGTAKSVTASTTPPSLTVTLTYNGSATAPINAGTYQVIGTVSDAAYYGSATNNLVIAKAAATVMLGSLSQIYDGTAKAATATTAPPSLAVTFTYDGSANAPTNIGTYVVVGTIADVNYQGSATGSLAIVPAAYFGTGPGSVTVSGGSATVVMSGVEGLKYSVQRATDVAFTVGISNFPTATAPAGGNVSVTDDFADLGTPPATAFYRLHYVP